ncbi:hypothetical protein GCM10010520_51330 [Rhizobium viscosum]
MEIALVSRQAAITVAGMKFQCRKARFFRQKLTQALCCVGTGPMHTRARSRSLRRRPE